MEDNTANETSQYNEAQLQIMRLHELWLAAEHWVSKGHLLNWKFTLDKIFRELYTDILRMKEKVGNGYISDDLALREKISHTNKRNILYFLLDERHRLLKEIQDQAGKGGRYVDTDSEDFD